MLKPKKLKKGDTVALVGPSSPCTDHSRVDASVKYLESVGFRVKEYPSCRATEGYLSGPDEMRARDINDAFADSTVDGIICQRGGYGTPRIVDMLDYETIKNNPKMLLGFSDITGLIISLYQKAGLVTLHAPMPTTCMVGGFDPYTEKMFYRAIGSSEPLGAFENAEGEKISGMNGGKVRGTFIGGNLSLIAALMGSEYMFDPAGKIIFIEDVEEASYRIDRMLNNMRLAKFFDKCAGIVFGGFSNCNIQNEGEYTTDDLIDQVAAYCKKPILRGLSAGHVLHNGSLPMGIEAELDADNATLTFTESAFTE